MTYELPKHFVVVVSDPEESVRLHEYFDWLAEYTKIDISSPSWSYYNMPRAYRYHRIRNSYNWLSDSARGYRDSRSRGEYDFVPEEWWLLPVDELIFKFNSILGLRIDIEPEVSALL